MLKRGSVSYKRPCDFDRGFACEGVYVYQKLKKSRTSFSDVAGEMPETLTVEWVDIMFEDF